MKFLAAILILFFGLSAYAGVGSVNVMKCQDAKGREVSIDLVSGVTGGVPGSYFISVKSTPGVIAVPRDIRKVTPGADELVKFEVPGISVISPSLQTMDIFVTQARGTIKLRQDAKPVPMLCNRGPAFN